MNQKKNGFINLLFEGGGSSTITKKEERKELELKKVEQFVEEAVFIPRNMAKHTRIFRISDPVSLSLEKNSLSKQIKKMFVDGSHLTEVLPRRQLVTQNYSRNMERQRAYSPQSNQRHPSKGMSLSLVKNESIDVGQYEFKVNFDTINPEQIISKKMNDNKPKEPPQVFISIDRKDDFLSLDGSTVSSQNKNVRRGTSVRYRKIIQPEKKLIQDTKATLELKKELVKFYSNPFGNPENISAKAYILIEHFKEVKQQRSLHTALNSKINLEIASLTKIMTCIMTIQLCQKYNINIEKEDIMISSYQTKIEGTIAELQPGQVYKVQQLLYGLMLPSGNDASIALSIFCGELISKNREEGRIKYVDEDGCTKKNYYKKFIMEMNKKCVELSMKRTFFANSHGLPNNLNRSCASDLAILIDYALRNSLFRKIVQTKEFSCEISETQSNERGKGIDIGGSKERKRAVSWKNTHRFVQTKSMLYKGIKTGITEAAGPCLASLLEVEGRQFIIVVLGCRTLKTRYKDTETLRLWLCKKQSLPQ